MLPIDYGHVTNTVPQGLRALLSANQRDGVEAPERIGSRNWEQSQEIARLRAKLVQ
jgi:hypothetical protein